MWLEFQLLEQIKLVKKLKSDISKLVKKILMLTYKEKELQAQIIQLKDDLREAETRLSELQNDTKGKVSKVADSPQSNSLKQPEEHIRFSEKPPKLYTEYLAECEDNGIKPRQRKNALEYIQTTEPYRSQLITRKLFLCDLRNTDPVLTRKLETLANRKGKKTSDFLLTTHSAKVDREASTFDEEEIRECRRKIQKYDRAKRRKIQ